MTWLFINPHKGNIVLQYEESIVFNPLKVIPLEISVRNTVVSEYRFGELAARLHDAKAQGNDLRGQKEVDHFLLVSFHQSTCGTVSARGTNETTPFARHEKYTCVYFCHCKLSAAANTENVAFSMWEGVK